MGILSILGLMEETKNTVLSRGHDVKNWLVLGNDCYALECKDCKMTVMIKENPLSKWLHLESVRAHLGVSMYLAEVLSKLYTGLFSLLFYRHEFVSIKIFFFMRLLKFWRALFFYSF